MILWVCGDTDTEISCTVLQDMIMCELKDRTEIYSNWLHEKNNRKPGKHQMVKQGCLNLPLALEGDAHRYHV